ncbi:hypothetical protein [Nocardia cyriacigeorgica]|uniref:hypothetical protein n=1 Tax=Nocardia cyriacigeorgica TaxID=135487 RepID=UPI002B4B8ACC|nr:hypothetical protein [Nocardia cyriacigeorgica]
MIRAALPSHLWVRAAGLVSAMWGVGTLVGPTRGGAFAQVGGWRWAHALLLLAAVAPAVLGYRALPPRTAAAAERSAVPMLSLSLLTAAATVFSISSTVASGWPTAGCMVAGAVLLALFLVAEKRGSSSVLPRSTYQRDNPLRWVYLTVAALCAGVMTENFIPLFGQELGNLAPFAAGMLGAALSIGWVVSQLFSVNLGPAAAALSTTQLIAYTVTSAVAGTLVNLGGDSVLDSARLMTFGIAAITVAGTATVVRATPRSRPMAGQ